MLLLFFRMSLVLNFVSINSLSRHLLLLELMLLLMMMMILIFLLTRQKMRKRLQRRGKLLRNIPRNLKRVSLSLVFDTAPIEIVGNTTDIFRFHALN